MDLESKDLLELVRGRDRTEFQHLKSEIYRFAIQRYLNEIHFAHYFEDHKLT